MSDHTPGPWNYMADGKIQAYVPAFQDPEEPGLHVIAKFYGPPQDANARLAAAAPDLLAACEELVNCRADDTVAVMRAWDNARTVIAKAKRGIDDGHRQAGSRPRVDNHPLVQKRMWEIKGR